MKTLIVVVTCPRPSGISHLDETLHLLDENGAKDHPHKLVISDGPLPPTPPSWQRDIIPGGQRRGTRLIFERAMKLAIASDTDRLLYLEDDIVPCKNAVQRMLEIDLPPHLAYLTFFGMPNVFCKRKWPNAIYVAPATGPSGKGLTGNQAIMFPRKTFEYLGTQDLIGYQNKTLQTKISSCDRAMSMLIMAGPPDLPKLAGFHHPCLVQHIGQNSAAHPDRPFGKAIAVKWPGKDFDALSFPPLSVREPP